MATAQSLRGEIEQEYLEPRWPIALAILAFIALTIVLRTTESHRESVGNPWIVPGL